MIAPAHRRDCYICGGPIGNRRACDCGHPFCRKVMQWTLRRPGTWPRWVARGTRGFHLRAAVYFVECMAKPRTQTDREFAKRYPKR